METAISRINIFSLDKEGICNFIEKATSEALSGDYDLLEVAISLKALEEITKGLKERLQYDIHEEANRHGKSFSYKGGSFDIKIRNTPDYKSCNDSIYNEALRIKKEREAFLKTLKREVADVVSGEIIKPPTFRSTEYLQIKL